MVRTLPCHGRGQGFEFPKCRQKGDKMKICPKCNKEHDKSGKFCNRSCANSRTWTVEDRLKKSDSMKKYLLNNEHPSKGAPGWKHSKEMKELKRIKSLEFWDKKGRLPEEHVKLKNKLGVSAYRARKYNATPENVDKNLIKEIYKKCPTGYEVDHIIAIADGGKHHPDNLQYLPCLENRKKNKYQNYDTSLVVKWQDVI